MWHPADQPRRRAVDQSASCTFVAHSTLGLCLACAGTLGEQGQRRELPFVDRPRAIVWAVARWAGCAGCHPHTDQFAKDLKAAHAWATGAANPDNYQDYVENVVVGSTPIGPTLYAKLRGPGVLGECQRLVALQQAELTAGAGSRLATAAAHSDARVGRATMSRKLSVRSR